MRTITTVQWTKERGYFVSSASINPEEITAIKQYSDTTYNTDAGHVKVTMLTLSTAETIRAAGSLNEVIERLFR